MKPSRLLLTLVLFLGLAGSAAAQIPNAGFESWNILTGLPNGWLGDPTNGTISKSTTRHGGSLALKGKVVQGNGDTTDSPVILTADLDFLTGSGTFGFPVSSHPASVRGFYQLKILPGDLFTIVYSATNGEMVGIGEFVDSTSRTGWTEFIAPINYISTPGEDTAFITMSIGNTQGEFAHVGSQYIVDDLSLSNIAAGVVPEGVTSLELHQNYPNPFNPSTTIEYVLPKSGSVKLDIVDVNGKLVSTLVEGRQTAGVHRARFDAEGLPSGTYQYVLTSEGSRVRRVMQLVK